MYSYFILVGLLVGGLARFGLGLARKKKGSDFLEYGELIIYGVFSVIHGFAITGTFLNWLLASGLCLVFGLVYGLPSFSEALKIKGSLWKVFGPGLFLILFFLGQYLVTVHIGFSFLPVMLMGFILFTGKLKPQKLGLLKEGLGFVILFAVYVGGIYMGLAENSHQEWMARRYLAETFDSEIEITDVDYGFRGDDIYVEAILSDPYERVYLEYIKGGYDTYGLEDR